MSYRCPICGLIVHGDEAVTLSVRRDYHIDTHVRQGDYNRLQLSRWDVKFLAFAGITVEPQDVAIHLP